jgi:Ca-activated chloride channel homolog
LELAYQSVKVKEAAYRGGELATVRSRYKMPDAKTSQEMVVKVGSAALPLEQGSENIRFAAAVAEWGMLLRGSEFKGSASWQQVEKLARGARGSDEQGDRAEFIRLVETSALLKK